MQTKQKWILLLSIWIVAGGMYLMMRPKPRTEIAKDVLHAKEVGDAEFLIKFSHESESGPNKLTKEKLALFYKEFVLPAYRAWEKIGMPETGMPNADQASADYVITGPGGLKWDKGCVVNFEDGRPYTDLVGEIRGVWWLDAVKAGEAGDPTRFWLAGVRRDKARLKAIGITHMGCLQKGENGDLGSLSWDDFEAQLVRKLEKRSSETKQN